jgi:hypothetical protein
MQVLYNKNTTPYYICGIFVSVPALRNMLRVRASSLCCFAMRRLRRSRRMGMVEGMGIIVKDEG